MLRISLFYPNPTLLRRTAIRPSMTTSPVAGRRSRPKATLFCPECEYEAHIGGDWVVRTAAARLTTECPDCGTRIDERPRRPDRSRERPPAADPSSAVEVFAPVSVLLRFQRHVLDWWSRHGTRYVSPRSSA